MKPLIIWAHLDTFFFTVSKWDQRKNAEKLPKLYIVFSAFFLWSPLGNYEKKSCLNELKFWEASINFKWSICWKSQYSISKIGESPPISVSSFPNGYPLFLIFFEKKCSSSRENLLKLGAEGREFAKMLRSLDQFIQTMTGQNNFG